MDHNLLGFATGAYSRDFSLGQLLSVSLKGKKALKKVPFDKVATHPHHIHPFIVIKFVILDFQFSLLS